MTLQEKITNLRQEAALISQHVDHVELSLTLRELDPVEVNEIPNENNSYFSREYDELTERLFLDIRYPECRIFMVSKKVKAKVVSQT